MKNVIGVVILAIVCIGLGAMLFSTKQRAEAEKQKDVEVILNHSNQWVKTSLELDEQQQVNQMLTNDLTATRAEFAKLTNKFTEVVGTLGQTEASLRASQSAVAERDAKISALENQNRELDEKAVDLSASLANLTLMIAETERKLEASEGDKAFLEGELKRLMAEKSELERQFNDLAILRAQVSRLREELSIARRLDWIRRGILGADETKGATRLMNPRTPTPAPTPSQYDLNVEIDSDGTVKVIAPLTNTPATNP